MDLGDIGSGRFVDVRSGREKGRYFLLAVDLFSRRVFAEGLSDKSGESVTRAFKHIASNLPPPHTLPRVIVSDQGREFFNKKLRGFLEANSVELVPARGGLKARKCREVYSHL